jgi:hypothetical protein
METLEKRTEDALSKIPGKVSALVLKKSNPFFDMPA